MKNKLTSARREILKRLGKGDVLYALPEKSGIGHALLHRRNHNSTNLRHVKFETLNGLIADGWIERKDEGATADGRVEFVLTERGQARYGYGNGRVTAKTRIIADRPADLHGRARVPHQVRAALGARLGDVLVFMEGCEAAHQRVLQRKGDRRYFVLYLEAAPTPAVSPETLDVLEEHERLATADGIVHPPELEPFEVSVRKKLAKDGNISTRS